MGDPVGAARHVRQAIAADGTWLLVEPMAGDRLEDNLNPIGRAYYGFSTLLCTPHSLSQDVGLALGTQAGPARLRDVTTAGGFTRFAQGRRRRRSTRYWRSGPSEAPGPTEEGGRMTIAATASPASGPRPAAAAGPDRGGSQGRRLDRLEGCTRTPTGQRFCCCRVVDRAVPDVEGAGARTCPGTTGWSPSTAGVRRVGSAGRVRPRYADRQYVDDAVAVLDATGTEQALLVGLSRGVTGRCSPSRHVPDRVTGDRRHRVGRASGM